MDKPNCYECKYRGGVPGDAHSCCNHPAFKEIMSDPVGGLLSMLGKRMGPVQGISSEVSVKGKAHGVRMGWFNHPFNFDPVWLEECSGYTSKNQPQSTGA